MQSMPHDAYEHEQSPEQWVERAVSKPASHGAGPDVYEENQWAVLRREMQEMTAQRQISSENTGGVGSIGGGIGNMGQQQRNTDGPLSIPTSPFHALEELQEAQHHVDIAVVGIGGGGMNAINRMMSARVRGVRFIAMNTDAQVLALSPASDRVFLGQHHTRGLGAGGNASVGMRAATESVAAIRTALGNANLVFIAAGMGGGTGTGAAPVVASVAKKLGALTVGIVTLPFSFEGTRRRRVAMEGLNELGAEIDALITVPNDRLLTTVGRDYSLSDAFKLADDVLRQGVQGIAEVINVPGMVNVDFADVRSVLRDAGTALMSIGQGQGRSRAQRAAEEAIAGGFLNVTIRGAKRVLFNISGGDDMTLFEVNEIAERIGQAIDDAADITFGAVVDPTLNDAIRVTLIAAGMEEMLTTHLPAVRLEQIQQATQGQRQTGLPAQPMQHPAQQPPYQPQQQPPVPQRPAQQPYQPPIPPQQQPPPVLPQRPYQPSAVPPVRPNTNPQAPMPPTRGTGMPPAPTGPRSLPSRPVEPQQQKPPQAPQAPPARPETPPNRPRRSLSDLRGLRSLGRRHEDGHDDQSDEPIDIPPFLKRQE